MSDYRRLYEPGGIYFFTLVTSGRRPFLCEEKTLIRLKKALHYTKKKYPFRIIGLVILPDHIHCIWQLPVGDSDFSTRWSMVKRYFSIGIKSDVNHRREKDIWQRRFWEHLIKDEGDLERCLEYIHYNPVKHGYVNKPYDWVYGTFKRDAEKGLYEIDWCSDAEPTKIKFLKLE